MGALKEVFIVISIKSTKLAINFELLSALIFLFLKDNKLEDI